MAINAAATVNAIVEHRSVFFKIMDFNEKHSPGGPIQFTQSLYNKFLSEREAELDSSSARMKLNEALSVDNLVSAGLTAYSDDQSGCFELLDWAIDMIRFFEKSRLRTLSSAELTRLHDQIAYAHDQAHSNMLIWDDSDTKFQETVNMVQSVFLEVTSKLQQNAASLEYRAQRLSALADSDEFAGLKYSDQYAETIREILSIYDRNILPTMQFMDKHIDIKSHDGMTPVHLLEEIQKLFESRRRVKEYKHYRRFIFEILTIAERVKVVQQGLSIYVKLAVEQRRRYNRIEERYNRLRDAALAIHDGRLKKFIIKTTDPIFKDSLHLRGIKDHQVPHSSKLDWPKEEGRTNLDEYMRISCATYSAPKVAGVGKLRPAISSVEKREGTLKLNKISKIIAEYMPAQACSDLHFEIHEMLLDQLPTYELPDLIDALELIKPAHTRPTSFTKNTIKHRNHELNYYPISVPAEKGELSNEI